MIRLATVKEYPAIIDLLNAYPSFSAKPRETQTMLLSASSQLPFVFGTKIAVVIDTHQCVVGCMFLNEGPYFLRAESICLNKKLNWQLMLTHMQRYLARYARMNGYPGYSLAVSDNDFIHYFQGRDPDFGYISYHRSISGLRGMSFDNVKRMDHKSIAELRNNRKHLAEFARIELKIPLFLSAYNYMSAMGKLDLYQEISEEEFKHHADNLAELSKCVIDNGDVAKYLINTQASKLVITYQNSMVGYATFTNTERHPQSIEITDFCILPKYTKTDAPRELLLAVGKYASSRGAKFMCSKGAIGGSAKYLRAFYESADMVPDEYTFVFLLNVEDEAQPTQNTAKTSVFSV